MKFFFAVTILLMIGLISPKVGFNSAASTQSTTTQGYYTKINWQFNNTQQQLVVVSYDLQDPAYQDFIDVSLPMAFYSGEWEIGSAYLSLGVGNYLYLSVQFLGVDGFSRYDTATALGLDFFELIKASSIVVQEVFVI